MRDIAGKVIWLVVMFFMFVTLYSITITQDDSLNKRALFVDMCDFVDSVVDSRVVTEAELKEFNNKIASYGFAVDYTITREIRSVDPDPLNPGKDLPTWIPVDDDTTYNQGDKITLHVWSFGKTSSNMIASGLLNTFSRPFDQTITARVR